MQGWRGATMIHDEHERDKNATSTRGVQQMWLCNERDGGCNKCGCAMNVMAGATNVAVQQMRWWCNKCDWPTMGAMECERQRMLKTGARIVPRAWCVGDSNTKCGEGSARRGS